MNDTLQTLLFLFRFLITFFLLYYFFPSRIFKHKELEKDPEFGFLDKLFIFLIHSNFATIIIVYILASFKIYETFSLILSYLLVIFIYSERKRRIEGNRLGSFGTHITAKTLDYIEKHGSLPKAIYVFIKNAVVRLFKSLFFMLGRFAQRPIETILLAGLFGVAVYSRFWHSFVHVYYASSDPYVHLAWMKYMGNNELFRDGVYPYGYHAVLSALNKIFFTDPSIIIRFVGPLAGCLIILSIYYILSRQFKKTLVPAVAGVAAYVLNSVIPASQIRQISALTEEYALIFLLPGMYFLSHYFETRKKYYLVLAAEVLALCLFIHLYVAVFVAIGYILICIINFKTFFKPKIFLAFSGMMVAGGILGLLPIILGLASGREFHAPSIDFIRDSADNTFKGFSINKLVSFIGSDNIFLMLFLGIAILACFSIVGIFLKRDDLRFNSKISIVFVIFTFFLYVQYRAEYLGVPSIMHFSRVAKFLAVSGIVSLGMLVGSLDIISSKKYIGNFIKTIAAVLVVLSVFSYSKLEIPIRASISDRMEYDQAARTVQEIKDRHQVFNWTIISAVEQYPQVINYGFHYNIWEYVRDITVNGSPPLIPTQDIYWFIEKIPLNQDSPITLEDSKKEFPVITGMLDEYYTVPENRRIIMAKAYYYLRDQLQKNPNLTVYSESDEFVVFRQVQPQYIARD